MTFAAPLPAWLLVLVLAAIAGLAWRAGWREGRQSLAAWQRGVLVALRALALLLLLAVIMRPVRVAPDPSARETVAVLVDTSRSMGLADADGRSRLEAATRIVREHIEPTLRPRFAVDLLAFGEDVQAIEWDQLGQLQAAAPATDIEQAMAGLRRRPRPPSGVIVVSDGGFVLPDGLRAPADRPAPVFAIAVGAPDGQRDVEVRHLTAGDAAVSGTTIDLTSTIVRTGFGSAPVEVRVSANGRPIESRRVLPGGDGVPEEVVFEVGPDPAAATLFAVEAVALEGELTAENNRRAVLVPPPGRARRVLLLEGAPGFEHSFLKRALDQDRGLEIDAVVRKGANESGRQTYYVQAETDRGRALTGGFPASRQALFVYDGIVLANLEADTLTTDQLALLADFVAERGGGLLVLGSRTFQASAVEGTALEELLPVEVSDRRSSDVSRTALNAPLGGGIALTADGARHPVMRIAPTSEESRARWTSLPALPAVASVGGARPGATVLAMSSAGGNAARPLVAVHRYGRGRVLAFAGEASWRWRMMLPSTDTSYSVFWRQAVRWVAASSPEPVAVRATAASPGRLSVVVDVRDDSFRPVRDANVEVNVLGADGARQVLTASPDPDTDGAYRIDARVPPGATRLAATATSRGRSLGTGEAWALAGTDAAELAEPRRDDAQLARLAERFGGRLVEPGNLASVVEVLAATSRSREAFVETDAWQTPWIFLPLLALLVGEWALRRRWGLR